MHAAGRLLPTEDDDLRDRVEGAARLLRAIRADLSEALARARRSPGAGLTASLGGYVPSRLYVRRSGSVEELWLAVATRDAEGRGVKPELRDYVFAALADLVEAADWEWRTDWPIGGLRWFGVARLGISAAPET